jgi:hypothetical protein
MLRPLAVLGAVAALALAAGPASGLAAGTYRTGTYTGRTSQGKPVRFGLAKSTACNTGKPVNGVNQFKPGLCVTFLNETPKIYGHCNGNPDQFGNQGGNFLLSKAGTLSLHSTLSTYDLKVTLKVLAGGKARGTGHFHEEFDVAPTPGAAAVHVVCDSGTVTFSARRSGP